MNTLRDQTLALAGVAQFALYAHELATNGMQPGVRINRALHAIYCTDPDRCDDVFDGVAGSVDGQRFLRIQLQGGIRSDKDMAQVSRYVGQILRLSGRLQNDPQRLQQVGAAVDQARTLSAEYAPAVLDEAYQQTISSLRPRLMIQGQQEYLANPRNTALVRCFLMAAVRCAILWRQSGGGLWRLVLQRKGLAAALAELGAEISTPPA